MPSTSADSGPHILIMVNSYPPRLGGLEEHVYQLATSLSAIGTRVTVVTLAADASDVEEDGIRVIRLRRHFPVAGVISFPGVGTLRRLARMFSDDEVSAISTHTRFFPLSYLGVRLARRLHLPLIHTEHGAGFVVSPSKFIAVAAKAVDLTIGRYVLRRSTVVLAVSQEVSRFVEGLAGRASTIFYNALDVSAWRQWSTPVEMQRSSDAIAFLGRLVPGKGWEEFLDVARSLAGIAEYSDIRFEILGDGPDRKRMEKSISDYGLVERTTVHGHADSATVRSALRGAVLVNPSRLAEGFQITVLEAAAMGCQIVSYPVPSVAPLMESGAPIRLVEDLSPNGLLSAVRAALDAPLPAMRDEALEGWSWETRGEQYLAIVEGLAQD